MTPGKILLYSFIGFVVLSVIAALVGRHYVRKGAVRPLWVRTVNRLSGQLVDIIRQPITVAVLDEVAAVLRSGHYTKNIASALRANQDELMEMMAEKIKADPTTKVIGLVPFHDRMINEASETVMRVIFEVLADPRTDELVGDMLTDNLVQLRQAVRAKERARLAEAVPPGSAT